MRGSPGTFDGTEAFASKPLFRVVELSVVQQVEELRQKIDACLGLTANLSGMGI